MSKKVPKLRFKGFDEEWEDSKLGEYAKYRRGSFPQPYGEKKWYGGEGAMPFVQVVDVTNHLSLVDNTKQKISLLAQPKSVFVKSGTVVVTLQGSIGRVAVTQYDSYLDRTLLIFEDYKNPTDKNFWAYIIQQKFAIEKEKAPGGTIKTITKDALSSFQVSLPSFQEQEKIGKLFKAIDTLISLRERRLDLLKEQKKGFLQKLFPKAGEVAPELRFSGFIDDWEEFNFGDIFDFPVSTNSLSRAMLNYDNGEIKNVHYGDVLIKYTSILDVKNDEIPYITDSNLEKYETNLLSNGDLIFADAAEDETVGKAVEVIGITNEYLVSGLHTIVARSKYEKAPYFLGYYINSNIYHKQLLRLMQGSKVSSISKGNLLKTNVSFPKNIFEQEKIGKFLKKLDNNISYQQSNVNLLKEQKKGLLHTIFI